jgi:cytochrome c556
MSLSRKMHHLGLAALLVTPWLGTAVQAAEGETANSRAIEFREAVMTLFSWNLKPMGAMMKGDMPYDAVEFQGYAKDLAQAAGLDLLGGFPEGSEQGETAARMDIWMNWDDFKAKLEELRVNSKALAEVAMSGDAEKIKPAFGAVGGACKGCHDAYKD